MSNKVDKFSTYGFSFQLRIIICLMTDRIFLSRIADALELSYFDNEAVKWIISTIKEYHAQYKDSPTFEALKVYVEHIDDDVLKVTVIEQLKASSKYLESTDLEHVKETTIEFCRTQCVGMALMKSADLYEVGNIDAIKLEIDSAMLVGIDDDLGHDYINSFEDRISSTARPTVSTGWNSIDELTDGGLGAGELGVIVGGPGAGKTWGLVHLGKVAVESGLMVVHYTLELNDKYVGLRYDSSFTKMSSQKLKFHAGVVMDRLSELPGRMFIKYHPTKSITVSALSAHIEKMTQFGVKPELVIVDYADLLSAGGQFNSDQKRFALDNIYEELRGMAGHFQVPVWTASQANRSSAEYEVVEATAIAESYGKVMIADFVMSLSRKVTDKLADTARWHIIKNRFGPDGITLPSSMITSTGEIEIYDTATQQGKEQTEKMDKRNEYMRRELAKKYDELG